MTIMTTISIDEIQRDLMGYLRRVKAGEAFMLLEDNEPVAEIKPVVPNEARLRPYALCAGEFGVPEDFNAPLPDEVMEQFQGQ